jgi:NAD:arginine ADP-ribosyltransferase
VLSRIIQDGADRKKMEESISISLIPNESQSLQSRNANFLWFILYMEVLFRMHHPEMAKDDLIELCKSLYADRPDTLSDINDFKCDYTPDKAIWWYTTDTCFYRLVNTALRCRDYDMLYALRFFITDIATNIKRAHEKFIATSEKRNPFMVYRGQFVSNNELQLMLENVGEFISMNSFLSTSRQRETAMSFLQSNVTGSNNQCVVFEITIDPRSPTKSYADIKEYSSFPTEDEVLIIFGALFRIESITKDSELKHHVVQVSLANDDDYHLKEIFNYMKKNDRKRMHP